MACVAKYNLHNLLDYPEHPRKRRRLTSSWDVLPSGQKAQHLLDFTVQALENGEGFPDGASSPSDSSSEHGGSTLPCPKSNGDQPFRYVSPPWRNDDKEGHYQFSVGDNLTPRYKIICKMGEGTFGQVLECWDRTSRDLVAIKVTRGLQKYREDALIEIDVLREVAKYDKTGKRCVQMREWFDYRNHTCIVFEKLGPSLYDYLKKNSFRPFPIYFVREIGRQLLESIAYMHDLKLVHTDLKPENILFVSSDFVKVPDYKGTKRSTEDNSMRLPKSSAIKLIDFGSTVFEDQDHMSVISTRHYRAPEVILGIGWNYPCDIWSVGCILVELCTGETLFQTHENLEHLAMMERILGPLPRHMIKRADSRSAKYFRHRTRVDWPEGASSRESIRAVRKVSKLGVKEGDKRDDSHRREAQSSWVISHKRGGEDSFCDSEGDSMEPPRARRMSMSRSSLSKRTFNGRISRKRRRLSSLWDVLPSGSKAHEILDFSGQDDAYLKRDVIEAETLPLSLSLKSNGDQQFSHKLSPPWRNDDKEGHYVFALGDNLTSRYKILSKMGQGSFGQVLECWDRKSKDIVAIKINRGLRMYQDEAMMEINVLHEVAKHDQTGKRCVQMREWFDYRNHTCIVFEKLGPSLYDYLRKNSYRPLPIDLVQEIGKQLLESIAYMHDLKLVHTDLKPENILFVSSDFVKVQDYKGLKRSTQNDYMWLPKLRAIKLIDFGSATFEEQEHTSVISTRHYRAPEVILGLGWDYPCDIWSVGCILVELCLGETLFQTHENLEHLAMMERVFGPLPIHMIKKANGRHAKYFRHGKRLDWPEGASSSKSIRAVRELSSLRNLILPHVDHSAGLLIDLLQ
ncbi:hypothetical protein KI387_018135, partial [Taxus chinensis]